MFLRQFLNIIVIIQIFVEAKSNTTADHKLFRITGGKDTNIIEAPYLLQLLKNSVFFCTATLISPTKAVTAGRTSYKSNTFTIYEVIAGKSEKYNYYTELFDHPIPVALYFHPDYCCATCACSSPKALPQHNIAVAILSEPLEYSAEVQPIKLPQRGEEIPVGQMATVFGWGNTHPDIDITSDYLKSALVEVIDLKECRKRYEGRQRNQITDDMICAGTEPRINICRHDLGVPLVINNVLYGIATWGFRICGDERYPSVYTNIINYIDFIESEYEQNGPDIPIPDNVRETF